MTFQHGDHVWYYPALGHELSFAGVVVGLGSLPDTYRVKMAKEYWAWIGARALLNRPSQEAPALHEENLRLRDTPCVEIDEPAPPGLRVNYGAATRTFEEAINQYSKVELWQKFFELGEPIAVSVATGKFDIARQIITRALELEEKLRAGLSSNPTGFTVKLVMDLGGALVDGKWMFPREDDPEPKARYSPARRCMTRCQADDDDYCDWKHCPQNRDGEPKKSGRHCPLDQPPEEDDG